MRTSLSEGFPDLSESRPMGFSRSQQRFMSVLRLHRSKPRPATLTFTTRQRCFGSFSRTFARRLASRKAPNARPPAVSTSDRSLLCCRQSILAVRLANPIFTGLPLHQGNPSTVISSSRNRFSETKCSRVILSAQFPKHEAQHALIISISLSFLRTYVPTPEPRINGRSASGPFV